MKIVAVGTLKGGVGKTSLTFNILGILAQMGKRVLGIDLDFQCNLSNNMGIDITVKDAYSSRDIFEGQYADPNNLVVHSPIKALPNLDLIPGSFLLTDTAVRICSRAARERILLNYIEEHRDFFNQYDIILMDTHPGMDVLNQNAFLAADSIILITDVDDNSLNGLELFRYLWGNVRKDLRKPDNAKALIINKANMTRSLTTSIREYCEQDDYLSPLLVPQMVRDLAVYPKAAAERVPVMLYANKNDKATVAEATEELNAVVSVLIERGVF